MRYHFLCDSGTLSCAAQQGPAMLKFFTGTILGAAVAFGYIRRDVTPPGVLQFPGALMAILLQRP